jgi:hypothetical protein
VLQNFIFVLEDDKIHRVTYGCSGRTRVQKSKSLLVFSTVRSKKFGLALDRNSKSNSVLRRIF